MKGWIVLVIVSLAGGCTTDAPHGPDYAIGWSEGTSSSVGPVACGDMISHPCPWLLFTYSITFEPTSSTTGMITWRAQGGVDTNGFPAEHEPPVIETVGVDATGIELADRGDDGGLRHATHLDGDRDHGWRGAVVWNLFNVAGRTSFDLEVMPTSPSH